MSEYAYFFTQGEATAENIVKCKFCSEDVPQKEFSPHLYSRNAVEMQAIRRQPKQKKQKHAEDSGAGSTSQQQAKEKVAPTIKVQIHNQGMVEVLDTAQDRGSTCGGCPNDVGQASPAQCCRTAEEIPQNHRTLRT